LLDIALVSNPGSKIIRIQIVIPITTTMQHILPTITATRETLSSIRPSPTTTTYQRGATPYHDHNSVAAGEHHAPSAIREQSRGCETLGL